MQKAKYPIYRLKWKTSRGLGSTYTRNKRKCLLKLNGLAELKTLLWCSFSVEYCPKLKIRNNLKGTNRFNYFRNESIRYSDSKIARKEAGVFLHKSEIKTIMDTIHEYK